MDIQQTVIEKRDILAKRLKYIAVPVVGFAAAPFVMLAIGGAIGGLIAAGIGVLAVNLAPWFSLKVANLRYRLVEAEKVSHIKKVTEHAAENPIETLTNLLAEKRQAFVVFEQSVTQAVTARENFKTKVERFKEKWPHRAAEFETQLKRMTDRVQQKKVALRDAQTSLEQGDLKLEEMRAYYEMSKDLIEANRAAGMDTGDAFEKLKADTACDAVFSKMNSAFAQLEVAAALEDDPVDNAPATTAQLGHSVPVTLDVTTTETQKVSRQ